MAKKKSSICLSCGHDFDEEYYHINPPITKDDKYDVKLTKVTGLVDDAYRSYKMSNMSQVRLLAYDYSKIVASKFIT